MDVTNNPQFSLSYWTGLQYQPHTIDVSDVAYDHYQFPYFVSDIGESANWVVVENANSDTGHIEDCSCGIFVPSTSGFYRITATVLFDSGFNIHQPTDKKLNDYDDVYKGNLVLFGIPSAVPVTKANAYTHNLRRTVVQFGMWPNDFLGHLVRQPMTVDGIFYLLAGDKVGVCAEYQTYAPYVGVDGTFAISSGGRPNYHKVIMSIFAEMDDEELAKKLAESEDVKAVTKSPGWQVITEAFNRRRVQLHQKLETSTDLNEITRAQAWLGFIKDLNGNIGSLTGYIPIIKEEQQRRRQGLRERFVDRFKSKQNVLPPRR